MPSGLSSFPRSSRMRAVMPTLVAVRMAPMNRATGSEGAAASPVAVAPSTPRAKGSATPPTATTRALGPNLRKVRRLVSSPAANRRTMDPSCASA